MISRRYYTLDTKCLRSYLGTIMNGQSEAQWLSAEVPSMSRVACVGFLSKLCKRDYYTGSLLHDRQKLHGRSQKDGEISTSAPRARSGFLARSSTKGRKIYQTVTSITPALIDLWLNRIETWGILPWCVALSRDERHRCENPQLRVYTKAR